MIIFISCNNSDTAKINDTATDTIDANSLLPVIHCDTASIDVQPVKDYKKALSVWLETTSLDWFLEKRQSVWREAKAWKNKVLPIDSNPILKCLCNDYELTFLYIPNHFYIKEKNGNEYYKFFIVNNSTDTINIPFLDAVVNNISSSISLHSNSDPLQQWVSFQQTDRLVDCGNSYWTMKLPPKQAIESHIESQYIGLGDTTVEYRLELNLDNRKIASNSIKINLMKKQLPYLGNKFE